MHNQINNPKIAKQLRAEERETKSRAVLSTKESWICSSCSATNSGQATSSYHSDKVHTYHYQCGKCKRFTTLRNAV